MRRVSIRLRLMMWYSAILATTFCAMGVGTWFAIRDSIHDTVDKDLRARLKEVRGSLQKAVPLPDGELLRIADSRGNWIHQPPGDRNWDLAPLAPGRLPARGKAQTILVKGKPFRVLSAAARVNTQTYAVQIGSPVDELYELLDDFEWTALWISPLILLLASAGGYWMSRRALEPVDHIIRTAQAIGAQNLSERLPVGNAGDELDRLSATLNAMFARLESAFRRITQFTADASHELRTPVAVIRTTAELAGKKPRSETEYRKALDQILIESERTSALLENLMLLARADAGAGDLAFETVDLVECLRDACSQARILAEAKPLSFDASLPAAIPVSGDYQALRRLFLILLDNAVKFTPPGGTVSVSTGMDQGATVVSVRDTGIGISPDDLPHIFERFYRAGQGRPRDTGGAGLGLSIARWIARRHGGEILVESTPTGGSVFRVRLPARSA